MSFANGTLIGMQRVEVVIAGGGAVGSATAYFLTEYIVFGEYRTIDSTPFSHSRYLRGRPLPEHNVI
jgi:hypothetical protein